MADSLEIIAASESTSPEILEQLASSDIQLARIVARNVAAMLELFTILSNKNDEIIPRHVAGNPNTPVKILWK